MIGWVWVHDRIWRLYECKLQLTSLHQYLFLFRGYTNFVLPRMLKYFNESSCDAFSLEVVSFVIIIALLLSLRMRCFVKKSSTVLSYGNGDCLLKKKNVLQTLQIYTCCLSRDKYTYLDNVSSRELVCLNKRDFFFTKYDWYLPKTIYVHLRCFFFSFMKQSKTIFSVSEWGMFV